MAINKICFATHIAGFGITLSQKAKDRFSVQYGSQLVQDIPYKEAALELGAAIMHALALEGKLVN